MDKRARHIRQVTTKKATSIRTHTYKVHALSPQRARCFSPLNRRNQVLTRLLQQNSIVHTLLYNLRVETGTKTQYTACKSRKNNGILSSHFHACPASCNLIIHSHLLWKVSCTDIDNNIVVIAQDYARIKFPVFFTTRFEKVEKVMAYCQKNVTFVKNRDRNRPALCVCLIFSVILLVYPNFLCDSSRHNYVDMLAVDKGRGPRASSIILRKLSAPVFVYILFISMHILASDHS